MIFALTIAGSDPSGCAGIQGDLKTFQSLGVGGTSVITGLTAQNTGRFFSSLPVPLAMIQDQLDAVFQQFPVRSVKTGMLVNSNIIKLVAKNIEKQKIKNLIVDPVLQSKTGSPLLQKEALKTLRNKLLPLALLVTPNLEEAELLAEAQIESQEEMAKAAKRIYAFGPSGVLIKGGDAKFSRACDLFYDGKRIRLLSGTYIANRKPHGTGCAYSAAIAAYLCLGNSILTSIQKAKKYMEQAIRNAIPMRRGYEWLDLPMKL